MLKYKIPQVFTLTRFFFLTLAQGKYIFFPVLFEYLGWEKVIAKLDVVHQQPSRSAVTIHPRMNHN